MRLKFYKIFSLGLILSLFGLVADAQPPMVVTTGHTAQQLAEYLTGEGVSAFNASMNCPTTAIGKFEVTGTNTLGIDSGIVLSSGHINNGVGQTIIGPNNGTNSGPSSTSGGLNTDPHLQTIATNIRDVCWLEFDFVPIGDSINFDYVFASTEYWSFSCSSFNDPFGFFIWGPGINNFQNIALIPGTNIPVTVNSTTGLGACSQYPQYYNDNHNGPTTSFGGYTDVFTAKAAVQACDTYTLKLAIADVSDSGLDSGAFLKAGSLSSIGIRAGTRGTAGANENEDHCVRGCKSAYIDIEKDNPEQQDLIIDLEISGSAVNGVDYEFIPDQIILPGGQTDVTIEVKPLLVSAPTGPRNVIIKIMSPYICYNTGTPMVIDSAEVWIYDSLYASVTMPEQAICAGDTATLTADVDPSLIYTWTPTSLVSDPGETTVTVSPNQTTTYTFEAYQPGAPATCPKRELKYTVVVDPYGQIILPDDIFQCLEDSISVIAEALPTNLDYTFTWSPSQYFRNSTANPNMFYADPGNYEITVEAISPNANCVSEKTMEINVMPNIEISYVSPKDTVIKYGSAVEIEARAPEGSMFYWDPITYLEDPNEPITTATPLEDMVYQVIALDPYGCRDTATIKIFIEYESDLKVPNAFTPDGDGLNDVFKIYHHEFERLIGFSVYNRYGQLVFFTDNINEGWDGTVDGGKPAGIDTYIYVIEYALPTGENKVQKGDVVLLR